MNDQIAAGVDGLEAARRVLERAARARAEGGFEGKPPPALLDVEILARVVIQQASLLESAAIREAQRPPVNFRRELAELINRHSRENGSDTPDFVLAEFLSDCLSSFDRAVAVREGWYGRRAGTRLKGEPAAEALPPSAAPSAVSDGLGAPPR